MKAILRLFVALPAGWVVGQNGVARVPLPYFIQLCENHRRCLIDACFRTNLLYNDTPLLLCLAILYTNAVPILSSLLVVHQYHSHRSLVTSPEVLVRHAPRRLSYLHEHGGTWSYFTSGSVTATRACRRVDPTLLASPIALSSPSNGLKTPPCCAGYVHHRRLTTLSSPRTQSQYLY